MLVAPFVQLHAADGYPAQSPPPLIVAAHQAIRFGCSPVTFRAKLLSRPTDASQPSCLGDSPVSWGELNQLTCCFVLVHPLVCWLGELGRAEARRLRGSHRTAAEAARHAIRPARCG